MIPIQDVVPTGRTPWATLALMLAIVAISTLVGREPALQASWVWVSLAPVAWPPLIVSLLFLWLFGDNAEARLGRTIFVALFILAGTFAAWTATRLDDAPSGIVSTGAITGVLGAYLVLLPTSRVLMFAPVPPSLVEVPAGFFIGLWWLLQLLALILVPASISGTLKVGPLWALGGSFLLGAATARLIRRTVHWRT